MCTQLGAGAFSQIYWWTWTHNQRSHLRTCSFTHTVPEWKPDRRRTKIDVTLSVNVNDGLKHEYTHNSRKREKESILMVRHVHHIRLKYSGWKGWITGIQMSVRPLAEAWVKLWRDLFVAPPVTLFITISQRTREGNTNDKWTSWELSLLTDAFTKMIFVKLRSIRIYWNS